MADHASTPQRKQRRQARRPGHDELFKAFFGQQPMVQSFLDTFVRLPFVGRLMPGTWRRLPCEFVDEDQRKTLGDMLWQAELSEPEGRRRCYVLILLEFQTTSERGMALRMLSYVVRALRHWQRERGEAHEQLNEERVRAGKPKLPLEWEDYPLLFPMVIPMVIHSGEIKWTAPLNTKRLFGEVPGELRRYVPDFEYAVFEIRRLFCAAPELRDSLSAQWVRFVQAESPAERVEPFREMLRLLDSVRYQALNELRQTFFHWFEHCFRENKIPGDWRHLLNKVPLSEVSDMYALKVREWEKQVAAKAASRERREMEKKQRDTLRKIVRTKFGMSLPRWLSGERDMDRVQRLTIAASCAENAAAFQARLDQERGGVAE